MLNKENVAIYVTGPVDFVSVSMSQGVAAQVLGRFGSTIASMGALGRGTLLCLDPLTILCLCPERAVT